LFSVASVQAQWQKLPNFSQRANKLFKSDNAVLASTDNGLFYTTNDGATWAQATGVTGLVGEVAKDGNTLLMGGYERVFKSVNNGVSWTALDQLYTYQGVNNILVTNGKYIAGMNGGNGMYYSNDSGATWEQASSNMSSTSDIVVKKDRLFVSFNNGGYLQQSNDGAIWFAVRGEGIAKEDFNFPKIMAMAVKSDSVLVAGVYDTWWYYAGMDGAYFSTDNGDTWEKRNNGLQDHGIISLKTIGNVIFAGTPSGGVYYTKDDGANWIALNTGLSDLNVSSLHIAGTTLYCGTATGVFKTDICNLLKNTSTLGALTATEIAADQTVTLLANTSGASYKWFRDGVAVAGLTTNTATVNTGGVYTVDVEYGSGCTDVTNAVTVVVKKLTPELQWSKPKNIIYGTALTTAQLNASANVPGNFIYSPSAGTVLNAGGNHKLSVHFTPSNTTQYETVDAEVFLNVLTAPQTITFGAIPAKIVTDQPFEVSATASSGEPVTISLSEQSAGKASIIDNVVTLLAPGSITLTALQKGTGNYDRVSVNQTLCIAPERPTVTAVTNEKGQQVITSGSTVYNQWYLDGVALEKENGISLTVTRAGKYSVAVVVEGCASQRSEEITSIYTSVEPGAHTAGTFCYPNPATESIVLDLNAFKSNSPVAVRIIDAQGHTVLAVDVAGVHEQSMDLSALKSGLYVIQISQRGTAYSQRVMKR